MWPPFRLITRAGSPYSDQLTGRRYHVEENCQGVAPPNQIPEKGFLFGPNTRWRYHLTATFRGRVTRPDQITGRGPPNRPITRTALSFRSEIPYRGFPFQIKYQRSDIPVESNTRSALSPRGEIPERVTPPDEIPGGTIPASGRILGICIPFRPNTSKGASRPDQILGRCYPLKSEILGGRRPAMSNTRDRPLTEQVPGRRYHSKQNITIGISHQTKY